MKMRIESILGIALTSAVLSVHGQTTVVDSSAGAYITDDLAGQNNWAELLNYDTNGIPLVGADQLGTNAFSVDNSTWVNTDAASDAAFLVTTNGSFVYLNEASAGNEAYSEWKVTMDFSFSYPTHTYSNLEQVPNANFLYMGLTSSTTNGLSQNDQSDIFMNLRYRASNRLDLGLQSDSDADLRIFQTPSDVSTLQEPAQLLGLDPYNGDCQSDDLRLVWTLRKSGNGEYWGWGMISNTTTGAWVDDIRTNGLGGRVVSTAGKNISSDVYASTDPVFAMGMGSGSYSDQWTVGGENGLIHVDIDDLTVVKTIVSPTELIAPSNLTVVAYDSQVTLSWDAAFEASSYDVFRSTTSSSYGSAYTNVTGTTLVDTPLVNDTEYFYVVEAVYEGVGSVASMEISGMPQLVATGSLITTDFSGYANGDLVNEADWQAVSGSSNNAFNVINSGTINAANDTESAAANFSTNTGNAVYLTKLIDNGINDVWSGHFDFQVSAVGTDLSNQDVFVFGISENNSDYLHLENNDGMALMSVKVRANGKIVAMFGEEENDNDSNRLAVLIGQAETGWDPLNDGATLNTDWIRYSWKIRKTTVDGVYQAFGSFSNMTQSVTAPTQTGVAYLSLNRSDLYDSPAATFVMGHYYKSKFSPVHDRVDIAIRDMSISHTNNITPTPVAPDTDDIVADGTDRTVTLSWTDTFETASYNIWLAETENGVSNQIGSATTPTYIDSPRWNDVINWYRIEAVVAGGASAMSEAVAGVPSAFATVFEWGPSSDFVTANLAFDVSNIATNGADVVVTSIADMDTNPFISGPSHDGGNGIDIYGYIQSENGLVGDGGASTMPRFDDGGNLSTGFDTPYLRVHGGEPGSTLMYFESNPAGIDATVPGTRLTIGMDVVFNAEVHAAIRNGSTWYVSETFVNADLGKIIIPDISAESWAPITLPTLASTAVVSAPTVYSIGDNAGFTDITAVGVFNGANGVNNPFWGFSDIKLEAASDSSSAVDFWMDGYSNVTNIMDDTDGDSLSNLKEFAFNGNPENDMDQGTRPTYTPSSLNETNGYIVVHIENRDPQSGIDYSLKTTPNLVYSSWVEDAVYLGEENIDYYWKSVTNFIPADTAAKFIELKVEETP